LCTALLAIAQAVLLILSHDTVENHFHFWRIKQSRPRLLHKNSPDHPCRQGISENTLFRWRDDFITAGEAIGIPMRQSWAKAAKEKLEQLMKKQAA